MKHIKYNDLNKSIVEKLEENTNNKHNKDFIVLDSEVKPNILSTDHPYMNNGLLFALCVKGESKIKINFKEYEFNEKSLLLIYPHSILEISERSENMITKGFFVSFDFITEIQILNDYNTISEILRQPCIKINDEIFFDFIEFYSFIIKQYEKVESMYKKEIAKLLFCALNLKIRSIYKENETELKKQNIFDRRDMVIDQFMKLLILHYREERNITYYADKLCLSPKYLSSIIKQKTGQPMYFWINEVLILEAKYQLKTCNLSIKEISNMLNFPTPSIFGRFFKQRTGMTPLEYKKNR